MAACNPTTGQCTAGMVSTCPAIDTTVASTVGATTSFLYTGANATQVGVPPGTIVPARATAIHGTVQRHRGHCRGGRDDPRRRSSRVRHDDDAARRELRAGRQRGPRRLSRLRGDRFPPRAANTLAADLECPGERAGCGSDEARRGRDDGRRERSDLELADHHGQPFDGFVGHTHAAPPHSGAHVGDVQHGERSRFAHRARLRVHGRYPPVPRRCPAPCPRRAATPTRSSSARTRPSTKAPRSPSARRSCRTRTTSSTSRSARTCRSVTTIPKPRAGRQSRMAWSSGSSASRGASRTSISTATGKRTARPRCRRPESPRTSRRRSP